VHYFLSNGFWNNKLTSTHRKTAAQSSIYRQDTSSLAETTYIYNPECRRCSAGRALQKVLLVSGAILACFVSVSGPAFADAPATTMVAAKAESEADIFPALFFNQYYPQTALDMINRLPGFNFDSGSDVRGFGAAAGNVLIDGVRPTTKSAGVTGGIETALIRIPTNQVDRIEILRGGVSGGEAAGQTIVANVIRIKGGSSGTWRASAVKQEGTSKITPKLELSYARTFGSWETAFDLNTGTRDWRRTADISTYDADDLLLNFKDEDYRIFAKWFRISADVSRPLAGGKLTLNGRLDLTNRDRDTTRLGYIGGDMDAGSHDSFWNFAKLNKERNGEIGADWNRTFKNDWKWRLIGLYVLDKPSYDSETISRNLVSESERRGSYLEDKTKSELILRSTYGKNGGAKLKPEFGMEFARNKLDNRASATRNGAPIALNTANVTVSENRGEAFASLNYQASSNLTLDSSLTFEVSKITVAGDANRSQTLNFLKPRLAATYLLNDRTSLTMKVERRVGQLDFNDFAASSQAEDGRITSGNPDITPYKKYVASTGFDWTFGERGSLNIEAFYEWRSDIWEQIILPSGGYGRGNAGNAEYWGVTSRANIPLDDFIKGGLLKVYLGLKDSSFADPIIGGEIRPVTNMRPFEMSLDFRQDIVDLKMAWGFGYKNNGTTKYFYSDVMREIQQSGVFSAFIETTRFFGVKMALKIEELNSDRYDRISIFYEGDRSGQITGREVSERKRSPVFRLEISNSF